MKLLRNLLNYESKGLEDLYLNGVGYRTQHEAKPTCIIGLGFGESAGEGSVDRYLAYAVRDAREYYGKGLPALVQADIGKELKSIGESNFYSIGPSYDPDSKSSLIMPSKISSKKVIDDSITKAQEAGIDTSSVLYISHPAHMERVLAIGKKDGLYGSPFITAKVVWNKEDNHKWTRSPSRWLIREILTRIHHMLFGYA